MITLEQRISAERMRCEHQDLERRTTQLRSVLNQPFNWSHMECILASLERMMLDHFEMEEAGGYLAEVVEAAPYTYHEVEDLLAEHEQMRDLLHRARHAAVDASSRDDVREILGEWLDLIDEHEHRENMLAITVFNTDLGSGD